MKKPTKLKFTAICLILLALPPIVFFGGFEIAAYSVVTHHQLPQSMRNSVKHAYAAAVMSDLLLALKMKQENAQQIVLLLGRVNEHVESYSKLSHKDSAAETRKDTYNNWAGIVTASWRHEHAPQRSLTDLLAYLAGKQLLMPPQHDSQADSELSGAEKIAKAKEWLEKRQQKIARDIVAALEANL